MSSHSQAYARKTTENDPLRGFAAGELQVSPRSALSLLAQVLDTVEDAFCVCDGAGRIQHENPAFRQLITRRGEVGVIRAHVRSLARDAAAGGPGTAPDRNRSSTPGTRSAEFMIGDVPYRLKASPMRSTGPDHPAALLTLEVRGEAEATPIATLQDRTTGGPASVSATCSLIKRLTRRELEVVHLLSRRRSNREIAAMIGVSLSTAKRHTENILGKLGLRSRFEVERVVGISPSRSQLHRPLDHRPKNGPVRPMRPDQIPYNLLRQKATRTTQTAQTIRSPMELPRGATGSSDASNGHPSTKRLL